MATILSFIKTWTLPISILLGIAGYYIYTAIPALNHTHHVVGITISIVQPTLIFMMLFITFCKVKFSFLRLRPWHFWLLAFQSLCFSACAVLCAILPKSHFNLVIESFMICMICPTATAAAVVATKLGGNPATLTTYTILINLVTAILIPALIPIIHPTTNISFIHSFLIILGKVFPLLFCPFLLAMILRKTCPRIIELFTQIKDLAFYMWAVALALAIAVTVKTIVHSDCPTQYLIAIAIASALACILQFAFGRYVGKRYGEQITAAQSCGQKNTVLAIWLGYTFLSPVTSLAGGFYSIWHNIYNSWQLYQKQRKDSYNLSNNKKTT